MEKFNYFDVGNKVKIGSDEEFQYILNVNYANRTILVNTIDYGFIWYDFKDVTDKVAYSNLMYLESREEINKIIECLKYAYPKDTKVKIVYVEEDLGRRRLRGIVHFVDGAGNIYVKNESKADGGIVVRYGLDKIWRQY